MVFYHVDRRRNINECGKLEIPFKSLLLSGITFDSVSCHGNNYLYQPQSLNFSREYEIVLEYIRTLKFPKFPSRFQCLFASKTKEEALEWAKKYCTPEEFFQIIVIQSDIFYEFDYSWFSPEKGQVLPAVIRSEINSLAFYMEIAYQYWSGNKSFNPRLEVLIPYPVDVVKIEDYILHLSANNVVFRK